MIYVLIITLYYSYIKYSLSIIDSINNRTFRSNKDKHIVNQFIPYLLLLCIIRYYLE